MSKRHAMKCTGGIINIFEKLCEQGIYETDGEANIAHHIKVNSTKNTYEG
jgi:hypothetical protein